MMKCLSIFLAASALIFASEKEEKGQQLCNFTSDVFAILEDQSHAVDPSHLAKAHVESIKRLRVYENGENAELAELAEKFIASIKDGEESQETLGDAISSLGRLVKCSVDDEYYRSDTSFMLHKKDVQKALKQMESHLGDRVPQGKEINFHKVMIESLAEQKYDVALYAYFKIAEERCHKS